MKIAFLDRDGVINKEVNYLYKIDNFVFTPNCIDGLRRLREKNFEIVIITNQAGIAKGFYSVDDYNDLTFWYREKLLSYGVDILDILYCPHHPNGCVPEYSIECNCRKPKTGLLEEVAKKYQIDIKESILVGDKQSDLNAGISFGISKVYLVETGHKIPKENYKKYHVYSDLSCIPL
ncbi:D-glycero-alpha-D-manno-heptose-1,7-bisphosphate 7-phosphatase [Yersinia pseudotuberculosis]|uniref:D-glycero-alpha-D-manno-heptose-1,7-bisphosphate 7-phosphatase n=1 Tax=Yersinia pseudotuberculosis TaxID=633 RepID=UPI0004F7C746|nr:HAD family hydrolase [Yersinia pseudotuberculosis]AIN13622.1 D,D-heptose 1,7-bisphosphate phosphatase [Yersinia pseudotuberculosis]